MIQCFERCYLSGLTGQTVVGEGGGLRLSVGLRSNRGFGPWCNAAEPTAKICLFMSTPDDTTGNQVSFHEIHERH